MHKFRPIRNNDDFLLDVNISELVKRVTRVSTPGSMSSDPLTLVPLWRLVHDSKTYFLFSLHVAGTPIST